MRTQFVLDYNPEVHTNKQGKRYIIHPFTKERIYEWIPEPVEVVTEPVMANLQLIDNLFPKINL